MIIRIKFICDPILNGISFRDQSGQALHSNFLNQLESALDHASDKFLKTSALAQGLVKSLSTQVFYVSLEFVLVDGLDCVFANVLLNVGCILVIVELSLE